jgi:hypothetical protein
VSLTLADNVELAGELVAAAGDTPVVLQPNAGTPRDVKGKLTYAMMPEHFADAVTRIIAAGVRIVGGCCGTTPAHIQAMVDAIGGRASGPSSTQRVESGHESVASDRQRARRPFPQDSGTENAVVL